MSSKLQRRQWLKASIAAHPLFFPKSSNGAPATPTHQSNGGKECNLAALPPFGFSAVYQSSGPDEVKPHMLPPGIVETLSKDYWPRYDSVTGTWNGDSAATMLSLTKLEIIVISETQRILDSKVRTDSIASPTHKDLYLAEDNPPFPKFSDDSIEQRWDRNSFLAYCDQDDYGIGNSMYESFYRNGLRLFPQLTTTLKSIMQRPRAQQAAYILGFPAFNCLPSLSAGTPSFVGGHALKAAIAGSAVYILFRDIAPAHLMEKWSEYVVGIADRRVFAGQHYPTDNFASWHCALATFDMIFKGNSNAAQWFLKNSIIKYSKVYSVVTETFSRKSTAYSRSITALNSVMHEGG